MNDDLKTYTVRDDVSEIDGRKVSADKTVEMTDAQALYHVSVGILTLAKVAKKQ